MTVAPLRVRAGAVVPLPFRWASFTRENHTPIDTAGKDRHVEVANALQEGPVLAPAEVRQAPSSRRRTGDNPI
jgi:hypothetical protein